MKKYFQKKVLIINSELPIGGIGKYTFTLAKIFPENTILYAVITHQAGERYYDFVNCCKKVYNLESVNKYFRYLYLFIIIWKIKPFCIIINNNAIIQHILPYIPKCKRISIIHSDSYQFYHICSINAKHVSKWIAPSPRVKINFTKFLDHQFSEKIKLVPHGTKIALPICLDKSDNELIVTFIGMLFEHKGIYLLPTIIEQVTEKCKSVMFNIIGDGDLKEWLIKEIQKRNIAENVRLWGNVSDEVIDRELSKSQIFLLPTKNESFGLSIIEAMAHGVVPVVSLITGITDYIIDNRVTGFLADENDPNEFSSHILKLITENSLRKKMSENAYNKASEMFSLIRMSKAYNLEIFQLE